MTRIALLPSPLLGPVVWSRVAVLLRERGHRLTEVGLPDRIGSVADVLDGFLSQLSGSEPMVLVPHSNAGLYVASLAARRPVAAVVFADALVPGPDPATPTTSPGLRAMLADLADEDGWLPPWTRWWPRSDTDVLFPDALTRRTLEGGERRLPFSYFEETVPTPRGWQDLPAAYLAFGDTYADERDEAARRGWPVATVPGLHLHPLVDPAAVGGALEGLLARLGVGTEFP
jgi:pimeloyl-ACP methyl ester carboxylesterase